jgi:hypothetical protein
LRDGVTDGARLLHPLAGARCFLGDGNVIALHGKASASVVASQSVMAVILKAAMTM